jgi:hypothetical protein
MSELGAKNRPTTFIHPYINNFPIGVLFIVFGTAVLMSFDQQLIVVTGWMMIAQGTSHLVTGLFPCDEDLGITKPSLTQHIHNAAGIVMLLSFLIPMVGWAVIDLRVNWFVIFSWLCLFIFVIYFYLMAKYFKSGHNLGLYQRLSYGVLAFWSLVLSVHLFLLIW